jgi:transcriptional regulator with XRE-family HTH domain
MPDTLGARVQALLEKNGVTQIALARQIGLDQTAISRIIVRDGYQPGAFVLYKIAKALGTTVDALLDGLIEYAPAAAVDTSLVARFGQEIATLQKGQAQLTIAFESVEKGQQQLASTLEQVAAQVAELKPKARVR